MSRLLYQLSYATGKAQNLQNPRSTVNKPTVPAKAVRAASKNASERPRRPYSAEDKRRGVLACISALHQVT